MSWSCYEIMAQIILSQKNKPMLLHRDNLYHFHSNSRTGNRKYWRCFDRRNCNARCTTNANLDNIAVISDGTESHLHPPNVIEARVRAILGTVRLQARGNPTQPPSSVVRQVTARIENEEMRIALPQRNALIRMVSYQQNQNRPPVPASLREIVILEPYDKTLAGENFVIFDSGVDVEDRVMIFSTNRNIELLADSDTLFSDGTYKTVPNQFLQLFSIHGIVRGFVFPLVFCLTVRKTEETYTTLYRELKNHARNLNLIWNPIYVVCDFELANMNACRVAFPQAIITGCLFHYTQSIWRNVVNKGLRASYLDIDNPTIRQQIQEIMALPFIPLNDLRMVWDLLNDSFEEDVLELASYVEATYISGRPGRGRR